MNTTEKTLRIGICGYGNLGRGVEQALAKTQDMELLGIFTRRDPSTVTSALGCGVHGMDALDRWQGKLDVLMLCGGSRSDLPEQTPVLAEKFNVIDSFDTHAHVAEHFARVDDAAARTGHAALISVGWDPGLFSLMRVLADAVLPAGRSYTFWGRGVSQGHSDAIRRIPGVANAVQYTVPITDAVERVRRGEQPTFTSRQKHWRECHVVLEPGADRERVRQAIVSMPDYFADYDTTVHFISAHELARHHAAMPHGGFVIRSGETSPQSSQVLEFRLKLDSNPEFTASVLVAYARALHRMHEAGRTGALTLLDVPPALISPHAADELRRQYL